MSELARDLPCYVPPEPSGVTAKRLIADARTPNERQFVFYERVEIGRDDGCRERMPGLLLIADPTVSWMHCILTQTPDGHCFVRDISRHGGIHLTGLN